MTILRIDRPEETEYAPYFGQYVALVPAGDVLGILASQIEETASLLGPIPTERGTHRYAAGKWSINQVMGHLADTERVFAYRALWFSRRDPQPLPGFEQDTWVAGANFDARTPADLIDELRAVRHATLTLFRSLTPEALMQTGTAEAKQYSVRAIPFIIAGHERHHVRVLRERYLSTHTAE